MINKIKASLNKMGVFKVITSVVATLVCTLGSVGSYASDITRNVQHHKTGLDSAESEHSGYFELGLGLDYGEGTTLKFEDYESNPSLSMRINAGYRWKKAFVDLYPDSVTPIVLGYNILGKNNYSIDLVTGPLHGEFTAEDLSKNIEEEPNIEDRKMDYMAGFRFTHYLDKTIVQLEARKDISNTHNGDFFLLIAGRSWNFLNGSQHVLGGVAYQSEDLVDYYLSVSPEEASENIGVYDADSAFLARLEYGITYPLTRKWVIRTNGTVYKFDNTIAQSTLMVDTSSVFFSTSVSINYVF